MADNDCRISKDKMDIFFADDSAQNAVRDGMGKVVGFGGVIVGVDTIRGLFESFSNILQEFSVPVGTEVKWSPPRDNWIHGNLISRRRKECYSKLLSISKTMNVRAIVAGVDCGRFRKSEESAFQFAVNCVFERLETHLAKRNTLGILVADRPGGGHKQDNKFLEAFLDRVEKGTDFVKSEMIILNALTTPSKLVPGLQLADIVVGCTVAMVCGKYRYAKDIFRHIQPLFIKNYIGFSGGTGLKLFPDKLMNLYYHLLGEDNYVRVSQMAGYPLPREKLPYVEDILGNR